MISSKCKKHEAKDYLPGSWGILTYKENDTDRTSEFNISHGGYRLSFDAKGNFTEFYRNAQNLETTIKGTWTLENNNLQLTLVDNNPNSTEKLRVYTVVQEITNNTFGISRDMHEYDLGKQ